MLDFFTNTTWTLINTAVGTVQLVQSLMSAILEANYFVISNLVTVTCWITYPVYHLVRVTANVIMCLGEDLGTFLIELSECFGKAVYMAVYFLDTYVPQKLTALYSFILFCVENVSSAFGLVLFRIQNFISTCRLSVLLVVELFGNLIVLLLSTIVHTLQLIPEVMVESFKMIYNAILWAVLGAINSILKVVIETPLFILKSVRFLIIQIIQNANVALTAICNVSFNAWLGLVIFLIFLHLVRKKDNGKLRELKNLIIVRTLAFREKVKILASRFGESWTENRQLRRALMEIESRQCVVCSDDEKCVVLLPCRHMCLCVKCWIVIQRRRDACPICRNPVLDGIHVYL